jgi:hypothetical protein
VLSARLHADASDVDGQLDLEGHLLVCLLPPFLRSDLGVPITRFLRANVFAEAEYIAAGTLRLLDQLRAKLLPLPFFGLLNLPDNVGVIDVEIFPYYLLHIDFQDDFEREMGLAVLNNRLPLRVAVSRLDHDHTLGIT